MEQEKIEIYFDALHDILKYEVLASNAQKCKIYELIYNENCRKVYIRYSLKSIKVFMIEFEDTETNNIKKSHNFNLKKKNLGGQ